MGHWQVLVQALAQLLCMEPLGHAPCTVHLALHHAPCTTYHTPRHASWPRAVRRLVPCSVLSSMPRTTPCPVLCTVPCTPRCTMPRAVLRAVYHTVLHTVPCAACHALCTVPHAPCPTPCPVPCPLTLHHMPCTTPSGGPGGSPPCKDAGCRHCFLHTAACADPADKHFRLPPHTPISTGRRHRCQPWAPAAGCSAPRREVSSPSPLPPSPSAPFCLTPTSRLHPRLG